MYNVSEGSAATQKFVQDLKAAASRFKVSEEGDVLLDGEVSPLTLNATKKSERRYKSFEEDVQE